MLAKKILIPVFAVVVTGSTLLGVSSIAHAQSGSAPFSGLAQAIASKFNLNTSDVQNVISAFKQQQRANWQQNMQQREKKRLDRLVSQGKITNSQETAILSELSTLQGQFSRSSLQGMTQKQRRQAFLNEKNAIESWANSQVPSINPKYVMPFRGYRVGF